MGDINAKTPISPTSELYWSVGNERLERTICTMCSQDDSIFDGKPQAKDLATK